MSRTLTSAWKTRYTYPSGDQYIDGRAQLTENEMGGVTGACSKTATAISCELTQTLKGTRHGAHVHFNTFCEAGHKGSCPTAIIEHIGKLNNDGTTITGEWRFVKAPELGTGTFMYVRPEETKPAAVSSTRAEKKDPRTTGLTPDIVI